jgi:heparin binding hemagglutinin HbhA
MATKTEARRIPNPLYAAAGAGDLAYQQLRKLPERMAELRERVNELRPAVTDAVSERSLRGDIDRFRQTARRNAAVLVNAAEFAQERALALYTELVARGERVVATARATEAKAQLVTAKAEAKDATVKEAEVHAADVPAPTATKKATRPAATTARK